MGKTISICAVLFFFAGPAMALQSGSRPSEVKKDTTLTETDEKAGAESDSRILIPGANPYAYAGMESWEDPEHLFQSGAFISTIGAGLEATYRPGLAPWYGSVFFSSMINPERKIPGANRMFTAGLTIGFERLLHSTRPRDYWRNAPVVRMNARGTQFYARIGPGFGVAGVGEINSGSSYKYHPAFHTTAIAGSLMSLSKNTSIYLEIGGRAIWYPSLHEMGLIGGPQLNIGIQFNSGPRIPAVNF